MGKQRWIQLLLLALALSLCLYGAWRGEIFTVFIKGSNICLECIGLG